MSETRKYSKLTPAQTLELVRTLVHGQMPAAEICREHGISETLLRRWSDQLSEAGGAPGRQGAARR